MNPLWIALALGVLGAVVALTGWSLRGRRRPTDLGFVSHQWVSEHRQDTQP